MNCAIPLILVLAAAAFAAAQGQGAEETVWSTRDMRDIVPAERAALASFNALYAVSPTGHVTAVDVLSYWETNDGAVGLSILSRLRDLEKLIVDRAPKSAHAMDGLTELKRLTYLKISSGSLGDEHLAVVAKIPNLRSLTFGTNKVSAAGIAQLSGLQSLESLTLSGFGINDESLSGIVRLDKLTALDPCTRRFPPPA
jgi:hypothetical protein